MYKDMQPARKEGEEHYSFSKANIKAGLMKYTFDACVTTAQFGLAFYLLHPLNTLALDIGTNGLTLFGSQFMMISLLGFHPKLPMGRLVEQVGGTMRHRDGGLSQDW
jgi:hypothetical protein